MRVHDSIRYTDGTPASQGDKVRTVDSGENAYLRVLGVRGYVTVWHPDWPVARVYHISEIGRGHGN